MTQKVLSRNLILIYVLVVLDSTIAALVLPIFPDFVRNVPFSRFWLSFSFSLFRFTQLFSAPFLGYLSDKWGRKPIFLIATAGTFVSYLLMLPINLPALLANRFLDGSSNGFYTAVRASITDISSKKNLERNLGILGGLGAIGLILGPGIGGLFLGFGNFRFLPEGNIALIWLALILAAVDFVIASFIKETKPKEDDDDNDRQKETFRYRDLIPNFLKIRKHNPILGQLIIMEIIMTAVIGYYQYFIIFASSGLNFTNQDISTFMVYFGVIIAIAQVTFFFKIANYLTPKLSLIITSFVGTLVLLSYSVVNNHQVLYLISLIDVFSVSLVDGVIQGQIGKYSPEDKRGSIIGMVQGFAGIVAFINPLFYGLLSEINVRLPFVWFALCCGYICYIAFRINFENNNSINMLKSGN